MCLPPTLVIAAAMYRKCSKNLVARSWYTGLSADSSSAIRMRLRLYIAIQLELVLGELRVDLRQREAVERQVPRRVPRVLPLVGHGDDVGVIEVRPVGVAAALARLGRRGLRGIAVHPLRDVDRVELLAPKH